MITKVTIIGDAQCGKSTLLAAIGAPLVYQPGGFDYYVLTMKVEGKVREISVWNISGLEELKSRFSIYSDADVFLVCFSIGDLESLKSVEKKWVKEIQDHRKNAPIVLVGNKKDLRDKNSELLLLENNRYPVMPEQGQEVAKNIEAFDYMEICALNEKEVLKIYEAAVKATGKGRS